MVQFLERVNAFKTISYIRKDSFLGIEDVCRGITICIAWTAGIPGNTRFGNGVYQAYSIDDRY